MPGIPIDMVAGTSIGAFVGAVYAAEADPEKTTTKCREWSMVQTQSFSMLTICLKFHKESRNLIPNPYALTLLPSPNHRLLALL